MIKVSKPTKKQLAANAKKMKAATEKFKELIKERENEAEEIFKERIKERENEEK